jgi:hypothetical protein
MGFFSKLKKVVEGVDQGAAIAGSVLPGKAGDVAKEVGVVTTIVQQIQSKATTGGTTEEAQKNATLVTAVAVDDHEQRMQKLEQTIQALQDALAATKSQPQEGSTGQATDTGTGTSTGSGTATGTGTGQAATPKS